MLTRTSFIYQDIFNDLVRLDGVIDLPNRSLMGKIKVLGKIMSFIKQFRYNKIIITRKLNA